MEKRTLFGVVMLSLMVVLGVQAGSGDTPQSAVPAAAESTQAEAASVENFLGLLALTEAAADSAEPQGSTNSGSLACGGEVEYCPGIGEYITCTCTSNPSQQCKLKIIRDAGGDCASISCSRCLSCSNCMPTIL